MQLFDVLLGDIVVGQLGRIQSGKVQFRFSESYRLLSQRPVLGQHFEDDLNKIYVGIREDLPAFFANLVPEGTLRELLQNSLDVVEGDDLQLLAAVGHDLPGAVRLRISQAKINLLDSMAEPSPINSIPADLEDNGILRFSLAGVQMKFSLLKLNEKLTLPVRDQQGNWIVKFDSEVYPGLVDNEFAVMEWARAAGFDVPECQVRSAQELPAELANRISANSKVYLIKRYDRVDDVRIHQEDLAQVAGLRPALKYDQWTYEICARVIGAICGTVGYDEFIRRLVFMVVSGNTDAHLKNWSLLYPDGVNATLTPLYDQVAVVAWPPPKGLKMEWALKFAGTKNLFQIDEDAFIRLAKRSGGDHIKVKKLVADTLLNISDAWNNRGIAELLPPEHTQALQNYWLRLPLLRNTAL